jgi:deoxyribodipyrimidine photolyase
MIKRSCLKFNINILHQNLKARRNETDKINSQLQNILSNDENAVSTSDYQVLHHKYQKLIYKQQTLENFINFQESILKKIENPEENKIPIKLLVPINSVPPSSSRPSSFVNISSGSRPSPSQPKAAAPVSLQISSTKKKSTNTPPATKSKK